MPNQSERRAIASVVLWFFIGVFVSWCVASADAVLRPKMPSVKEWPIVPPSGYVVPTGVKISNLGRGAYSWPSDKAVVVLGVDNSLLPERMKWNRGEQWVEETHGLPFESWAVYWRYLSSRESPLIGLSLGGQRGSTQWNIVRPYVIPLMPRLPWIVLDAAIWGVVSLGIWRGFVAWRGVRRRRAGLCASCAHRVGDLPRCPECGTETA